MKVLIVATVVKKHIMQFHIPTIRMLKDMGWTVDVAARNDYEVKGDCRIPYADHYYDIPINREPASRENLEAYKMLKRIIDEGGYDVVHCHTPMGGFLARYAARDARKKGTKVFYTVHGFHFFDGAPRKNWCLYYPAEKKCSELTDVLITICDEDYQLAKKKMKAGRIVKIPGIGIDLDRFADTEGRADAGAAVGVGAAADAGAATDAKIATDMPGKENGSNEKIMLSVGELINRKNHEAVIRALDRLDDKSIIYCIAGEGELKQHLEDLIRELHMQGRVELLGYRNDVDRLYKAADLFIQPSFQEGLPVAVMEAMASGTPVIASDIRGNRDLLQKHMLFDPKDTDSIAKAISDNIYRDNSEEIKRNRTVIQDYKSDNVLSILKEIYEDTARTGIKHI